MTYTPLKDLVSKNGEFREKLTTFWRSQRPSMVQMAKDIGISRTTLTKYMVDEADMKDLGVLAAIEEYLKQNKCL